ncbi:peptidase C14 [Durotheca rogersii]|uniref:peptidase C14 n=1 Tax=Durotheca rogersii TaxID=419775 RepID=UPI0022209CCE|nr:peptidase C14 [Durotheca rogersii]KAI5863286.1 peptidase C14 [Durotheca rogersii]
MARKKALLIGINYFGTEYELRGCINDSENIRNFLIEDRGFSPSSRDMVMMLDTPENEGTPFFPTAANILAAIQWLVTRNQPGDVLWLSYSGHGGQVRNDDGDRPSGFDDTICPVDFQENGQITSEMLHRAIVSPLHPECRLTILFDCCHSGSACELPYVYRPDEAGNVNMVDTIKQGVGLIRAAGELLEGGFSLSKLDDAKMLLGGATDFFNGLHHRGGDDVDEDGLAPEHFEEHWETEGKDVWMFSGCADNQTSADTSIAGAPTGAMSWAFVRTLRESPEQSYINILQNTREELAKKYSQIPQLSCGGRYDLDQVLAVRIQNMLIYADICLAANEDGSSDIRQRS